MSLFARFLGTLAVGLSGMTVVLMILMDRLFCDWDMFAEGALLLEHISEGRFLARPQSAQDAELDAGRAEESGRYLKRQKELGEIDAVETRLRGPNGPIVLTPLPPIKVPGVQ